MRRLLLGSLIFLVLAAVTGCAAIGGGGERQRLRKILDGGAPPAHELVGCSYASGFFGGETPSLRCVYFVGGDLAAVASAAGARLEREGFTIACRRSHDRIEISGSDGTTRIDGYTAEGAVTFDENGDPLDVYPREFASPPRKLVPPGSVALELGADRHAVANARDDLMPYTVPCRQVR